MGVASSLLGGRLELKELEPPNQCLFLGEFKLPFDLELEWVPLSKF